MSQFVNKVMIDVDSDLKVDDGYSLLGRERDGGDASDEVPKVTASLHLAVPSKGPE